MKLFENLSTVFAFLVLASVPVFGATDPDQLWNRAVEKRTEAERIAPRILRLTQEELNSSGGVKSLERAVIGISYDSEGKINLTVLSSQRNGVDFSAERKKRLGSTVGRWADIRGDTTPFDPELQPVMKRGAPTPETDGDSKLLAYPFELPLDKITMRGKARVMADAGTPYDVRYTLAPLPSFVDILDLGIKFKEVMGGGYSAETVSYRFEASFLFFTWRGRGVLAFEDWTELPVKPRLVR